MGPAIVSKWELRSTFRKNFNSLIVAVIVLSSNVAAFSNGRIRKFGSFNPRAIPSHVVPPTLIGKKFNQNLQPLQNREYLCLPTTTVCRSTSSGDDNAAISTLDVPSTTHLSTADISHMNLATKHARIGYGNTFPNPAVGCVLVRHDHEDGASEQLDTIIGSGFHPKAGMPHAEVFALLEACGHVDDGVAAARSVMGVVDDADTSSDTTSLNDKVLDLLATYKSEDGASKLFNDHFVDCDVTAYVTLEPCCHVGQTPPCALSLVAAGINRVVVGYRDPNPRVDGGGIKLLQDAGIDVHVLGQSQTRSAGGKASSEETKAAKECSALVKYFVKRISPREEPVEKLDDVINGKKRRVLRSLAGRQKSDGTIRQVDWPKDYSITSENKKDGAFADNVPLSHRYLERIDQSLWDHEIVLLRLNKVVQKKKGAKIIGDRIAEVLNAHVAQVIGHTALLYRPALPPVLDLDELAAKDDSNNSQ